MGVSRWTRSRGPWDLVHSETFATRREAMARERSLKSGRVNQELRARLGAVNRPSEEG
jgi:predicted GIY-YIG superfamily endonuclease